MLIQIEVENQPKRISFCNVLAEFDGDDGSSGRLIQSLSGRLIMQYGEHEAIINLESMFSNWIEQLGIENKEEENAS